MENGTEKNSEEFEKSKKKYFQEKINSPEELERFKKETVQEEEKMAIIEEKKEIGKEKEKLIEKEKQIASEEKIKPTVIPFPVIEDKKIKEEVKELISKEKPDQIKKLVSLAFTKGLNYSFEVAKKLNDPYILDELHDILVDELYEQLIKKDKLKSEE